MTPPLFAFLGRWWRRRPAHAPAAATENLDPPPAPVDEGCRPAFWVVQQGVERGLAGVELGGASREGLLEAFQVALQGGRPGAEEAAVAAQLTGSGWRWPEFERWEEEFQLRRQWPAAWQRYPSLAAAQAEPPRRVAEALPYFGYLERRDLLNARNGGRKSAPIRIEDLERMFLASFTWEELAPLAQERYEEFLERCRASREQDLCRLLAQHLSSTVYNLIAFHQGRAVAGSGLLRYRWEVLTDGDPLALEQAAAFNRGTSEAIPPYFPGDGSRLRLTRR
jgi:hypothetical protein